MSVEEGDDGTRIVLVPVTLSSASGRRIKFSSGLEGISATAGEDFENISEKWFLNAGQISKELTVVIRSDYRVEADETFRIKALGVENADTASHGQITIVNDDIGGTVNFELSKVRVDENVGSVILTISRLNGKASDVVVTYGSSDGSAVAGQDYALVNGTVTFGAKETLQTISIPIINDSLIEPLESFDVKLMGVVGGGSFGELTLLTIVITSEDLATVMGMVRTPDGRGLRNASVTLIDESGVTRTVITSSLGYYSFDNVEPFLNYRLSAASKRYRFEAKNITVQDHLTADFVGLE